MRNGLSDREKIEAIVGDRTILDVADRLGVHDRRDGGRPRHFSAYTLVLVQVLAKDVYDGRVRRTFHELHYEPQLVPCSRPSYVPSTPTVQTSGWATDPMQAHHYSHFRKQFLDCAEGREGIEGRLEQQGTDLTMEMGLFAGQGSLTNPDRATCIAADGKVIGPISTWTSGDRVLEPSDR